MSKHLLYCALIAIPAYADIVTISPTSLNFGNQVVGSQTTQLVVLSNATKKPVNIASITTTGSFVEQNACGSMVQPGDQCTITVSFEPTIVGSQSGVLSVSDDANNSPQKVKLTG